MLFYFYININEVNVEMLKILNVEKKMQKRP